MSTNHQRRPEALFSPASLADAIAIRRAVRLLVSTGCVKGVSADRADSYADAVIGWLVGKLVASSDRRGTGTRAAYRRILGELAERVGDVAAAELEGDPLWGFPCGHTSSEPRQPACCRSCGHFCPDDGGEVVQLTPSIATSLAPVLEDLARLERLQLERGAA